MEIWEEIAARYDGNPGVAGYDLINEPLIDHAKTPTTSEQKNDLLRPSLRRGPRNRPRSPDRAAAPSSDLDSIADPSTYGWTNVMYQLHPYDMASPKDWTAQNQLVTNELGARCQHGSRTLACPLLNGEYSLYYNDDVWARFMAGMNASNVSWSNWTYKVKGARDRGFAYWGMYYDNPHPVPIINSDDKSHVHREARPVRTANFTKNTTVRRNGGEVRRWTVHLRHPLRSTTRVDRDGIVERSGDLCRLGHRRCRTARRGTAGRSRRAASGTGSTWAPTSTVAMVIVEAPSWSPRDYPAGIQPRSFGRRGQLEVGRDRHRLSDGSARSPSIRRQRATCASRRRAARRTGGASTR